MARLDHGNAIASSNENAASLSPSVAKEAENENGLSGAVAASARCFVNPGFVACENDNNHPPSSRNKWTGHRVDSSLSLSISNYGYREDRRGEGGRFSATLPSNKKPGGRSVPFSRCTSCISLPSNRAVASVQEFPRRVARSSRNHRVNRNYYFIRRPAVRLKTKPRKNRRTHRPLISPNGQAPAAVRANQGDAEPRPAVTALAPTMPNNGDGRRHHGGSGRGPPRTELPPMGLTTGLGHPEEITQLDNGQRARSDALPDILHSHLPPPYSTLPPNDRTTGRRLPPPAHPPPPPPHLPQPPCHAGQCPPSPPPITSRGRSGRNGRNNGGNAYNPFAGNGGRLRGVSAGSVRANAALSAAHQHHHSQHHHPPPMPGGGGVSSEGEEPKHCCGVMVTQSISIRWFIVMIAFVGLCCAIVGTVLGALKATGREHLTVSLLMIGVGIVLITVSGIAWRLTSHDAPSCRAMLGLQPSSSGVSANQDLSRRFLPRVPPYGRPPHPYAAMLYPEFQYRPPPPSYQASMQEYRLRLLLLDRQQGTTVPPNALSPVSPPPTYRSHASSTLHSRPPLSFVDRDYSRPPSYRSRASSVAILRSGAPHASSDTLDSRLTRNDTIGDLPDSSSGCNTNRNANTPGTNTPSSVFMPGTPPSHSHSRDPSLTLSYLSHESLMFNDSAHSALPLSSADIARSVTDRSTLDRSTLERPPLLTSPSGESRTSVTAGLSDDSPVAVAMPLVITPPDCWTSPSTAIGNSELNIGSGTPEVIVRTGSKHPDINTVTIVQTTDSSQVRNQDTVIVTVTGTQQVIPNSNRSSGLRAMLPSMQMQLGPDGYKSNKNEVQILAQV